MELQIQDLISSIKKDGIETANQEAAAIIADAKAKAAQILADAKAEAEQTLAKANQDIELFRSNAALSAEQGKRDAMLAFRQEVQKILGNLLDADVKSVLNEKTLVSLLLSSLNGEDISKYQMEVNEVTDTLKAQLAQQLKDGLEIRPNDRVRAGFRLVSKDGSGYFDCTDEELSQMLAPFFRDIHI